MSAIYRNALLPDELGCLRCGEAVRDAEDYCPACDPSAFAPAPLPVQPWERVVSAVCWIALIAITVGTTLLLWRMK